MTGWIQTPLGELCDITMGQSPPSNTYNTEKNGLPFFQGRAEFSDLYPVPQKWCSKPQKKADDGDILISVRAPVGDVNIANQHCCIGRGLAAIKYDACPKFIFYFLKHSKGELEKLSTGSTFKAISKQTILNYSLFTPSLKEQHQIVAKIEELFSELDNGIESLKKAREQLKTYRQAVLKYAFEGKLTKEWRTKDTTSSWKAMKLGDLINVKSGNGLPKAHQVDTGDYLVYGGNGIMGKHNKYMFEESKLIIGRVGVHCGNVHITKPKSWITDNAFVTTFDKDQVGIKYLLYFIRNLDLKKNSSSTAQPVISGGKIYPIDVKIPRKPEQYAIVQEIESRLSVCDKIEQTIEDSLKKTEALRQSILKKAFSGELTRDWREKNPELISGENSAEKLLERVKAEKEKTQSKKVNKR